MDYGTKTIFLEYIPEILKILKKINLKENMDIEIIDSDKIEIDIKIDLNHKNSTYNKTYPAKYMVYLKNAEGKNKFLIASWVMVQMWNCCGICVSTLEYVEQGCRNKGLGTIFNKLRKKTATNMGYSLLFCTDMIDNKSQQKILKNNKWKELHTFKNYGSRNEVGIYCINLTPSEDDAESDIDDYYDYGPDYEEEY